MSGYGLVVRIRKLEEELDKLGCMMCYTKHGGYGNGDYGDAVAIRPKDMDSLPIYSRDAELFVGSIEGLEEWIRGVKWARDYDRMLFGQKHKDKRERKEQDYRNESLARILKGEEQKTVDK